MLQYSFDADLAKEYGVPEAIFVHRLYWWVRDNAANLEPSAAARDHCPMPRKRAGSDG